MFKRHSLEVKMVKTPRKEEAPAPTERPEVDFDKIHAIASKSLRSLVVAGVAVYAAVTAINTAADIVKDKTTTHHE